jgi:hypothetical protein
VAKEELEAFELVVLYGQVGKRRRVIEKVVLMEPLEYINITIVDSHITKQGEVRMLTV